MHYEPDKLCNNSKLQIVENYWQRTLLQGKVGGIEDSFQQVLCDKNYQTSSRWENQPGHFQKDNAQRSDITPEAWPPKYNLARRVQLQRWKYR